MNEDVVNTETVGAEQVPVENVGVSGNVGAQPESEVVTPSDGSVASGAETPPLGDDAAVVNPFDFTVESDGEGAAEVAVDDGGEEEAYVLDFGAAFGGTDAVRDMITGHARAAGISADAGSKFISSVCEELRQDALRQAQEGYRVLEEEWKADFGRRMERCKGTLQELLKEGVVSAEDVGMLMNPAVFRVVDKLRGMLGERSAVGTRQAAAASAKAQYESIMSNPQCEEFQILMNPSHPRYRQTADYVNGLAGSRLF